METCSNGHDDSWGTTLSKHPRDLASGVQNGFVFPAGKVVGVHAWLASVPVWRINGSQNDQLVLLRTPTSRVPVFSSPR